jgi:phage terminase large subunit-like protein
MCQMTAQGFEGKGSPDRVDALVWAVHDLLVAPAVMRRQPQIRLL